MLCCIAIVFVADECVLIMGLSQSANWSGQLRASSGHPDTAYKGTRSKISIAHLELSSSRLEHENFERKGAPSLKLAAREEHMKSSKTLQPDKP